MTASGRVIQPKRHPSTGWVLFAGVQIFTATVCVYLLYGGVEVFRQIGKLPLQRLIYWMGPLFALFWWQPMFGLNRFGRRMAMLNALVCVPLAMLAQWNSKLSDMWLGKAMFGL